MARRKKVEDKPELSEVDRLKQRLKAQIDERDQAYALFRRTEGAVILLEHMIKEEEARCSDSEDSTDDKPTSS